MPKGNVSILNSDLRDAGISLAKMHLRTAPEIKEIFLFPSPDKDEIRLIEIDPSTTPSSEILPYYFNPDPANGIRYASAIALIRPEEKRSLRPPKEWGAWEDGEKIWPLPRKKHGN